ncbi:EGF-like domain-containing protein [Tieghemostelium lacteum]|uniref:EGF-like domain-containing protein n=1 Tax=Tieghemostelium lacteum TaxID=361077 RepID=A0A151Z3Y2_TIELA|nr:EGF-like domain-containing protein [Tieghemostelium lacteum]|eukprot:KYQ88651.1 EGF-like domain-containing protein [Tieghemostelium lacteum]
MKLKLLLVFILLFLFRIENVKCDPSIFEIQVLQNLADTFNIPLYLSNYVCQNNSNLQYFQCDPSELYVESLTLTSLNIGSNQNLPSVQALTRLTLMNLGRYVNVPSTFWDNDIGTLNYLQTLRVLEPINQPSLPFGSTILNTLKILTINVNFNIPLNLFTKSIESLTLTITPSVTSLPVLTSDVSQLYTLKLDKTGLGIFSFNRFDLFPILDNLDFTESSVTLNMGSPTLPTSISLCTTLTKLTIGANWFTSTSTYYDFSNLYLTTIVISGSYLDRCQYPCILGNINAATYATLNIVPHSTFTSILNLDLSYYQTVQSIGGQLSSGLVDDVDYYLGKNIVLQSNMLSGAIPSSVCTASSLSLINNQFDSLPSCMKCNIAKFTSSIYPNPNLPVVASSSCNTLAISNYTRKFPTAGAPMFVYGVDLGDTGEVLLPNSPAITFDIPFRQFHFQVPAGVGKDKSITFRFYPSIVGSEREIPLLFDYMPPKITSLSIVSSSVTVQGSNFGSTLSQVSFNVYGVSFPAGSAYETIATMNAIGHNFAIPNRMFKVILTVGGQSDTVIYDNLQAPPKISTPLPELDIQGGSSSFSLENVDSIEQSLVSLRIDSKLCTITATSNNQYFYNYSSFSTGGLKDMVVLINGGDYSDSASIKIKSPTSGCVPITHSTCINNQIVCDEGWSGEDCSSQIVIVDPGFNNTSPSTGGNSTVTLPGGETIQFSTLVSILELREYNSATNQMIKVFPFNMWLVKKINENEYQYNTNFTNTITTGIQVNIKYFSSKQTIEFANQSITILPSTLKYQISISPYHFDKTTSTLMLVFNTQIERSELEESCSNINYGDDPTSDDYQFVRLQVNEVSLYGKFIKYGIVDNRTRIISNSFISDNSTQISTKSGTLIGINIPYFTKDVQLDPDFSVLIDTKEASAKSDSFCSTETESSKKLTSSQLAGIIIGVVGFALVVGVAVGYSLYKRHQTKISFQKIQQKLQQVNNNAIN